MNKKKTVTLVTIGVILLFALCFVSVYFYAQHVINKPKFEAPVEPEQVKTEIADNISDRLTYLKTGFDLGFYDETNVSKYQEAYLLEDSVKSDDLSKQDIAPLVISIKAAFSRAGESFKTYEKVNHEEIQNMPAFTLVASEVDSCEITSGTVGENGEVKDEDYYFFSVDIGEREYPLYGHTAETFCYDENDVLLMTNIASFEEYFEITDFRMKVKSLNVSGKTEKATDHMEYAEFTHIYTVYLGVSFKGDYADLGEKTITFDYLGKTRYEFTWYGARFLKANMYMNPKNSQTLPAKITVRDDAEKGDYKLTFKSSDNRFVTVDKDGIVTAVAACEKPVKITLTLEYRGITYTDSINVTVTELEVV